jgi:phage terminase Nu1 subunit (DNA packaging protein)
LEAYIATVTDSIDLLNTSIEKEEAILAREKKELQEIEKNAKNAKVEKERQMKNVWSTLSVQLACQLTSHFEGTPCPATA